MDFLGWSGDFLLVLLGSAALLAVGLYRYVLLVFAWVGIFGSWRGFSGFAWVGCGLVSCIGFISVGVWSLQLMSLLPIKCLCLAGSVVL